MEENGRSKMEDSMGIMHVIYNLTKYEMDRRDYCNEHKLCYVTLKPYGNAPYLLAYQPGVPVRLIRDVKIFYRER